MSKIMHKMFKTAIIIAVMAVQMIFASQYNITRQGPNFYLNGQLFKVNGLRVSATLVSQEKVDELISYMDLYKSYGINALSVYFMGNRFSDFQAFNPDCTIKPIYLNRMAQIIEAADARGMVIMVGVLYWGTSTAKEGLNWGQSEMNQAVAYVAQWLDQNDYHNTMIDPDNEGMTGRNVSEMIAAAKAVAPNILMGYGRKSPPPLDNHDFNVHMGPTNDFTRPYFDGEFFLDDTPNGHGYWGMFSKQTWYHSGETYRNYSRNGRWVDYMKDQWLTEGKRQYDTRQGIMLAGTWLQCSSNEGVGGPFLHPGGRSEMTEEECDTDIDTIHPDAGILWWLEEMRDHVGGAWVPPPSATPTPTPTPTPYPDPRSHYSHPEDFSTSQGGDNCWYYQYYNGFTWINMNHNGSYWAGTKAWSRIYSTWMHPEIGQDVALIWESPASAVIDISGSVAKANTTCGDGVNVKILKNSTVLWEDTIAFDDAAGLTPDINNISVAQGDKVYFILNVNGNASCDAVNWQPFISVDIGSTPTPTATVTPTPTPVVTATPQWGRFEKEFTNTKSYSDPFRDVTLNVTYTRPDNSTVDFWGFHDGGTSWKIRMMPDVIGTWKYDATFSDGTAAGSGEFTVVKGDIPGMLANDETNPIWFGFKGGNHGLLKGFHIGDRFFADNANETNWSPTMRTEFLDWAASMGYNFFSVASHLLNRDQDSRGRGWETPYLWDANDEEPNPEEYDKMEAILNDLCSRKMMIYPFAGWFGQSADWPTDLADQELYIKYNLARIGPYWNILINVAGPEPIGAGKEGYYQDAMKEDDINRIGAQIKRLDPFGHLVGIHNKGGNDAFREEEWTGFVTLQGGARYDFDGINGFMRRNYVEGKPVYAQETFWPGNKFQGDYTPADEDIRKKAWVLHLSGVTSNFADMNGNSSSGFSGSMDPDDKFQNRHDMVKIANDWFGTIPFWRMSPDNGKASEGFCLAEDGVQYLVYMVEGKEVDVDVKSGETYNVKWIEPKNPSNETDQGTTTDGQNLTPPAGGDDWLLLLTAEGAGDFEAKKD